MAEQQAAITLVKVCKSVRDQPRPAEVSLTLPARKIHGDARAVRHGQVGLLRCLVGLMKPDSGRIFIEEQDIMGLDERRSAGREQLFALRRKFGMLFQDRRAVRRNRRRQRGVPAAVAGFCRRGEIVARVAGDLSGSAWKGAQSKMPSAERRDA